MKKNYEKNVEQRIKRTTLLSSTIIILIVATVIGFSLIKTEYDNFKNHITNFKNTIIDRERFYIKTAINNLKNDIKFEQNSILKSKKDRIKNQSIIAYNLTQSLYKKTKNLSREKQIEFIVSSLRNISQTKNDINYFIIDKKGTLLLNSQNPKDENQNFKDFKDINGFAFINKIVNSSHKKQTFNQYFWYKPNSNITAKKIVYSRYFKNLDIIIGSGSFLKAEKSELKNRFIKKISQQNYNNEEYLLLYKINSLNNITTNSDLLAKRNIKPSKEELNAIKKLMIRTNYKGNNYITYSNNQKVMYGTYLSELRYFMAVGVNLSNIYNIIQKERVISLENMYSNIIKLFIIISIMTVIFLIFSILFTKKIEKLFENYKKRVIRNEQRFKLLFNYSNDAFIISEIKQSQALISSFNDTALNVTKYEKEELLKTDFFSLFDDLQMDILKEGSSIFKTLTLRTKEGHFKTVELNTVTFYYEEEKLLFASIRDITERTLLKKEKTKQEDILIQKSKMAAMGEMIGNIAHQWRQPLSQISGLFFDIESAYDFKELNKKYLENRVDEANDLVEYMSKTIDDFRNFFNPNSIKENFYMHEAVSNAVNIISSTLKYHNIKIEVDIYEQIEINGYKSEYSQAIVNIISNAKDILIERKIKNPLIKIYIKDKCTLCIEDNALGVDKEIIDKIFDPYFTTKFEYGTGIGLYMTKLIVEEKMDGSIYVENSNEGAIFSIKV